jgi:MFS family permease
MEENNNLKQYHFDPLKYYISFGFFSFSNGLFSIFINVLFFASSNISEVIYFQISLQISQTVFFLLGTYLIAYVSARFLYSLGAFLKAIVIASLFISPFFSGNAIYFGLLYGVSSGIFWTGNATFTLAISRSIKRFNFLSINSALSSLTSLIAPSIAGLLIAYSISTGIGRYFNDFLLASLLLVVSGIVSLLVRSSGEKGGQFHISNTIIREQNYGKFRLLFFASSILGMVMSTLIPVYVFYVTGNYVITGAYGTVTAFIGFIANILAPYMKRKIKDYVPYAIILVILSSFIYIIRFNYSLILIFFASSVILFFITPLSNLGVSEFMQFLDGFKRTRHFWINREYYLVAGRVLSLTSILIVADYFSLYDAMATLPFFAISVIGYIPALIKKGQ